jgi:hypothetical protein
MHTVTTQNTTEITVVSHKHFGYWSQKREVGFLQRRQLSRSTANSSVSMSTYVISYSTSCSVKEQAIQLGFDEC